MRPLGLPELMPVWSQDLLVFQNDITLFRQDRSLGYILSKILKRMPNRKETIPFCKTKKWFTLYVFFTACTLGWPKMVSQNQKSGFAQSMKKS